MEITSNQYRKELQYLSNEFRLGLTAVLDPSLSQYVTPLPELTKLVIYELFLNNIQQYELENQLAYEAIETVKQYIHELKTLGFVQFKNK
jgi:hypothetical protein